MHDVITIDGPAGSGKSTVSRLLARKIDYLYLDTGAMYRAVALAAKMNGVDINDGKRLGEMCGRICLGFKENPCPEKGGAPQRLFLGGHEISDEIRSPEMDMLSSSVSAVKEVREAMTGLQQKMAEGVQVVAEGRDMGTVVFPDARYKFFLTASPQVRADRRYMERSRRGEPVSRKVVETELKERDHQDKTRSMAPLKPARDAHVIDSSTLMPEEIVEEIITRVGKNDIVG